MKSLGFQAKDNRLKLEHGMLPISQLYRYIQNVIETEYLLTLNIHFQCAFFVKCFIRELSQSKLFKQTKEMLEGERWGDGGEKRGTETDGEFKCANRLLVFKSYHICHWPNN